MPDINDCPEDCYQGSTDFYDCFSDDQFTPALSQAEPLIDHVGTPWGNGQYAPWFDPNSNKSSALQYVEWFNGIWHTGDPSSWNATVFTPDAVMIDSSGSSRGAKPAADRFLLIFKFFPGLRGEVVSWAANDREIIINWRFQVLKRGGQGSFLVPVVDKFCFVNGRVSFRIAFFDLAAFIGYLSQTYGVDQITDFLLASFKQSAGNGGIQSLPYIVWNLLGGLFHWPERPPRTVTAHVGEGITLKWKPMDEAIGYKVTRATAINGEYESPPTDDGLPVMVEGLTYTDHHVDRRTVYWYLVSPVFAEWEPTPVVCDAPIIVSPSRRRRLEQWGYSMESVRERRSGRPHVNH
jgi:hypothetical protein